MREPQGSRRLGCRQCRLRDALTGGPQRVDPSAGQCFDEESFELASAGAVCRSYTPRARDAPVLAHRRWRACRVFLIRRFPCAELLMKLFHLTSRVPRGARFHASVCRIMSTLRGRTAR
jgi:hypothetical protein